MWQLHGLLIVVANDIATTAKTAARTADEASQGKRRSGVIRHRIKFIWGLAHTNAHTHNSNEKKESIRLHLRVANELHTYISHKQVSLSTVERAHTYTQREIQSGIGLEI